MRRAAQSLPRAPYGALFAALFVGAWGGCSPAAEESGDIPPHDVALNDARNLIVEIDYMPGAAPSFDRLESGVDPWLVFQFNLVDLAPPSVEGLSYPRSLSEMGTVDAPSGGSFSDEGILDLARRHRDVAGAANDAHFHVLFLDGTYAGSSTSAPPRALHIGDSRVIAMFGATPSSAPDLDRFLEQSALLHEFGHAMGLVGLGVPDVSGHTDPESAGHCTESDCLMQKSATLTRKLEQFLTDGVVPVLFGPRCLADLAAYYE